MYVLHTSPPAKLHQTRISFSITKREWTIPLSSCLPHNFQKLGSPCCVHHTGQILLIHWMLQAKNQDGKNTNKAAEMSALIQLHLNIKISMDTQKGSQNSEKYQVAYTEDFHLNIFYAKLSMIYPTGTLIEACESLNRLNLQDDVYHNLCVTSEGIQGALQLSATEHKDKEGNQCPGKKTC